MSAKRGSDKFVDFVGNHRIEIEIRCEIKEPDKDVDFIKALRKTLQKTVSNDRKEVLQRIREDQKDYIDVVRILSDG